MFEVLLFSVLTVIFTSVILLMFFKHQTHLIEIGILLVISVLFGIIFRWASVSGLTKDTEYWSTRFDRVEYYEPWNEYIEQTCSEECCCDSDGNNCSTTYYDCSYVEYHSARYVKVDHLGNRYGINKSEYLRLKSKMGNSSFRDMHRDYHTNDGDMYYTVYNGNIDDYECITSSHSYENKTQAVPNVFNYEEIDSLEIETFGLYDYPTINHSRDYQTSIIGYTDPIAEHKLQIINGELGHTKQVKIFILVYHNMPMGSANKQQSYWQGGNKNEVVVTINLDDNGKPTWCIPFSWSDKEEFKINIRNFVLDQDTLNMSEIVTYVGSQVESGFVRKEFADFDYLEVEMSSSQFMWMIIVNVIINIIASIIIVKNGLDDDFNRFERRGYNRIRRFRY